MHRSARAPTRHLPKTLLGALGLAACAAPAPPLPPPSPALPPREPRPAETAAPDELPPDAELDQLLARALEASPTVRAAEERWRAAAERVPQVTSLPDPRLTVRAFVHEVQTRVGPQELGLGLAQPVPWPGKLDARGSRATAEAEAAAARLDAAALDVLREVREAWAELYWIERAALTVRANRDLLAQLEEVSRSRYAAGETGFADVIRAQVELGRLEDRLQSLEDRRRPATARLNAALHRPPDAPLAPPAELPEALPLAGDERLREALARSSPALRGLRAEERAARAGVRLSELARWPDPTFGVEWILTGEAVMSDVSGSGDDAIVVSLAFDLPIQGARYRALEREARAHRRGTQDALEAETDRLLARLESELFAARDAERQIALYADVLVPRARAAYEATETAFRAGDASFLDLVDAERALLEFELSLERARADREQAGARLESLVGDAVGDPSPPETETLR